MSAESSELSKGKGAMTPLEALHDENADWVSIQEAARLLNMSEAMVKARLRAGQIHGSRVFGRWALLKASVLAYEARGAR